MKYIIYDIDHRRVRCYLIVVWRRGASGKICQTHICQYSGLAVKRLIEICSNQTKWLFSTNIEKCLAFHRICKTVPPLQHIPIYVQTTKHSTPVASSVLGMLTCNDGNSAKASAGIAEILLPFRISNISSVANSPVASHCGDWKSVSLAEIQRRRITQKTVIMISEKNNPSLIFMHFIGHLLLVSSGNA